MIAAEPVALVIDDCAKLNVLMKQVQVHFGQLHSIYSTISSAFWLMRLKLLECLGHRLFCTCS